MSVTVHILKHVKRVEEIGKYLLLEIEMMMGHEWEYIRVTACGSRSISTTTLYCCMSVSFAVCDGCEDDCGDRSLKHRFCHIEDMQARLELLEKLHVFELGDRWLLAQRLLRDFSVQQHT